MGSKWPIFAVLGLGLLASVCAAVLMAALKADGAAATVAPTTVEILVAKTDLPGMSKIEQDLLEKREISISERPEGSMTDPVQLLGRVLKSGVVAGQPILETVLLEDEGGAQLASSLPAGMRAVSVEINGSSALRGLLFPGSKVDVIVAYRAIPGSRGAAPVSRTLLQNVGVLAVEDKTVFSVPTEDGEDAPPVTSRRTKGLMVTLMVDPQQARELQSARDLGELSLSLRNPLDSTLTADPTAEPEESPIAERATEPKPVQPIGPWTVTVVRGGKTEVLTFHGGKEQPTEPRYEDRYADVPVDEPTDRID